MSTLRTALLGGALWGCTPAPTTPTDPTDPNCTPDVIVFRDADGDGFGSPGETDLVCSVAAGWSETGTDCDDADPSVHPGSVEVCDGRDSDCDASTAEAGAWFEEPTGGWLDRTAELDAGRASAPVTVVLDDPGALHLCEGVWYANLVVEADVDLVGHPTSGAVELHGGAVSRGIEVDGPHTVQVADLTLDGFVDPGAYLGGQGSALRCGGGADVVADRLSFGAANFAGIGGSVTVLDDCQLTLSQSEFQGGNTFGGGHLFIRDAAVTVADTEFAGGFGQSAAGSVYINSTAAAASGPAASFTCTECTFADNSSFGTGGAVSVLATAGDVQVALVASSFDDNVSSTRGGALHLSVGASGSATIRLQSTTFRGNEAQGGGNDLAIDGGSGSAEYEFGASPVTTTCDASGCAL